MAQRQFRHGVRLVLVASITCLFLSAGLAMGVCTPPPVGCTGTNLKVYPSGITNGSCDLSNIQGKLDECGKALLVQYQSYYINDAIVLRTGYDLSTGVVRWPASNASRAVINLVGAKAKAINGLNYSSWKLHFVVIDGGGPPTCASPGEGNRFLVHGGGTNTSGQEIYACELRNAKGHAVHMALGGLPRCSGANVHDNVIINAGLHVRCQPSGISLWGDGIFARCYNSSYTQNTIYNATDVGINAATQGGWIYGNAIINDQKEAFAGISMVDIFNEDHGDCSGTNVEGNTITGTGAGFVQQGIAMGKKVYACGATGVVTGGTVRYNAIMGDHVGYGFTLSGVVNWRVLGNSMGPAPSGKPQGGQCEPDKKNPPPLGKFLRSNDVTPSDPSYVQTDFQLVDLSVFDFEALRPQP